MTSTSRHNRLTLFACLASFALLLFQLDAKSLWVDELFSARVAHSDLGPLLTSVAQDFHPPLYFLGLRFWADFAGAGDFALRFLSVAFSLLSLPLAYRLGNGLLGKRGALVLMALTAFSPFIVQYGRMARYYSLVLFLSLASYLLFLKLVKQGQPRSWLGYLLTTAALLYTFYPTVSVLVVQDVFLLLQRRWGHLGRFLFCQAAAFLLFVPWLPLAWGQVQSAEAHIAADFASGPLGYLLKLGYPFFSFSVAEVVFPWHPVGWGGMLLALFLLLRGARSLAREKKLLLPFLGLFLPLLFTAVVTGEISMATPFLNASSRTIFAAPFLYLIMAHGITASSPARWLPLLGLLLAWGFSLRNYYGGWDFHNPIYIIPAREIAAEVAARARPEDVVVSDDDSAFGYYYERGNYERGNYPARHFDSSSTEAMDNLEARRSPQVWLITLGRDRTRWMAPTQLIAGLEPGYERVTTQGWAEQDATYRQVKELLLGRPAYRYKVELSLYQRKEAP